MRELTVCCRRPDPRQLGLRDLGWRPLLCLAVALALCLDVTANAARPLLRAFGDSTTDTVPSWATHVATNFSWDLDNQAVAGYALIQMIDRSFTNPVVGGDLIAFQCCVNDSKRTEPAYRTTWEEVLPAAIAFNAIPDSAKKFGTNLTAISVDGPWQTDPHWAKFGLATTNHGAKVAVEVNGTAVYVASRRNTGRSGGSFDLAVDGKSVGSWKAFGAFEGELPSAVYTNFPFLIHLTGLSPGPHRLELSVTSATGPKNWVWFDWASGNEESTNQPSLWFGNTSRRLPESYVASGGNDGVVVSQNEHIARQIAAFRADGLLVFPADIDLHYNPNHLESTVDGVHPNETGKLQMADAFLDGVDLAERTSLRLEETPDGEVFSVLLDLPGYRLEVSPSLENLHWASVGQVHGGQNPYPPELLNHSGGFFHLVH